MKTIKAGNSPQISVILPVYNGEKYLAKAIDSILAQSYADFEFILINDCSSDHTAEILSSYTDERIRIVNNPSNLKLSRSLNKGIELAQGKFIARMDADDISLPDRFEKQVAFLERHPDIGVVGCQIKKIDENGNIIGYISRLLLPEILRWELFFGPPLAHPSVMMRTDLIKSTGGYSNDVFVSEDYELWIRLNKMTKLANLPDALLLYRMHSENMTSKYRPEQSWTANSLKEQILTEYIGVEKAKNLIELIHSKNRTATQAVQAAELVYFLFRQYSEKDSLSRPTQMIVRSRVGIRIQRLVSPFHHSYKALIWLLRAYSLSPELRRDFFKYSHRI